ncbi:LysM peptidoglycan-binding domain-containing protein [Spirosoma flavum]|uniref:LysM peptidoglycan-binding domain-containing protein n=1 Tax=Spirosoma flavum TaxID=2048557 RepID=A0ABW6ADK4_9BACT
MKKLPVRSALWILSGLLYSHVTLANPAKSIRVTVADSIGIEKKDGKRFILHRVDEGQTLFSIARRYGRSVADIKAANPDLKDGVRYGQLVRILLPDNALSRKEEKKAIDKASQKQEAKNEVRMAETMKPKVVKTLKPDEKEVKKIDDPARAGIHVVEPRQTLYSLASRYGVSQSDLRKWNNLPGNNVLIGQALIVSEKAYLARTPSTPAPTVAAKTPDTPNRHSDNDVALRPPVTAHPTEPRINEPRSTTPTESKPEHHNDTPPSPVNNKPTETDNRPATKPIEKPAEKAAEEIEPPRPGNDAPMPTRGRRLSSSGVAEMIDGNDGSGKYLALHRTAPIGTLVQVRNEFNNQSLWVKVIGRLPNTGVNDKILIKLSTQAFAKLSPEDRRFRAEVSYIVR